jgi:hypothetical protein
MWRGRASDGVSEEFEARERPENRSPEQNSHTTENSGCGSEEPSNVHVIPVPSFDATSAGDQLFDDPLDGTEIVGDRSRPLGAIEQIGEMIG